MMPLFVSRAAGSVSHYVLKHAPSIWTGVGVAAMAASTATAIRASLDYKAEVTEPLLTTSAKIDASSASDEEKRKANFKVRKTLLIATARRFVLPIGLGLFGAGCIAVGNGIAVGRIAALSSALAAESARANGLLDKVKEALPEALSKVDVADAANKGSLDGIVNETMKGVQEKSLGEETDANVWFDAENPNWDTSEVISQTFITAQTTYLNQRLFSRGYVSLNDVYKALGMPETRLGAIMGWDLKQDRDAIIDLNEVKEYIGAGEDRFAVWGFNIQAPHNLIA